MNAFAHPPGRAGSDILASIFPQGRRVVSAGTSDPSPPAGANPGGSPAAEASSPTASVSTHAPSGGRKYPTTAVVAVVVGIIAFAAGILSAGAVTHSSTGGGGSAAPLTYDQAKQLSDARVAAVGGGTWEEIVALGVVSPVAQVFTSSSDNDCPSLHFYIPAFTGSISSGTASTWLFEYLLNPSSVGPGEILTQVVNGSATVNIYIPQGSDCSEPESGSAVVTGTVVDSPRVIANATAAGGGGFLAGQPNSTLVYELQPGTPNNWTIEYDPCTLVGGVTTESGTHSSFTATMAAATGSIETTVTGTTTCVSSLPYDIGLTQGPTGTLPSGADFDNFTVVMGAPLPTQNLGVWIQTSAAAQVYIYSTGCNYASLSDCPEPSHGWYATLSLSDIVQASYPSPFESGPPQWYLVPGATVSNIQNGETLSLVSDGPLVGTADLLALLGLGGASVTSETTL